MLSGRVVSDDSQAALTFHPIPGGAPANVAVDLVQVIDDIRKRAEIPVPV